ncbi:MAG: hypothetical protein PPP58_04430 [Natronomonas sp.]
MQREPAWVAAIRLALLEGRVDVDGIVDEANLVAGRERTVEDILSTMAERGLLRRLDPEAHVYAPGETLLESNRGNLDYAQASEGGAHRWRSSG